MAGTPKHKDRLTAVDASFLVREAGTHMHIGGVLVFEGPPPAREDFEEHVASRLHLVPRYRQKLAHPRLEMGRPMWIDDPSFNLGYHVRHSALPSPGSEHELQQLVGRIFSHPHASRYGAMGVAVVVMVAITYTVILTILGSITGSGCT